MQCSTVQYSTVLFSTSRIITFSAVQCIDIYYSRYNRYNLQEEEYLLLGRSKDVSAMSTLADTSNLLDSFTFLKSPKGERIHKVYDGMAPIGQVRYTVQYGMLHCILYDVIYRTTSCHIESFLSMRSYSSVLIFIHAKLSIKMP